MIPTILFIGSFLNGVLAQTDALTNATTAFSMSKIVPDVIDSFNPTALITMTFTDSVTKGTVNVNPGTVLSMERRCHSEISPSAFAYTIFSRIRRRTPVLPQSRWVRCKPAICRRNRRPGRAYTPAAQYISVLALCCRRLYSRQFHWLVFKL